MVTQLYRKFTQPPALFDARLDGEFTNLYGYINTTLALPLVIANGGTNSSTALNNNRVMQSASGKIVEAAAITTSRALVSNTNGIPVAATTTATELGFVNGVTSAIQTQINGKQATGNYVTALTGDVSATGPGSVAATLATVNGSPGSTTLSSVTTNGKGLVTANTSATTTGSGNVVLTTSPTLVTPLLGTPTSGVLTNCTGTASGLTAGTVTTNANLTGPITSSGNATSIASQTGTGTKFVVDTSPTLVTPNIGAATASSLTFSPTTSGIVGTTTNDNAGSGKVGEYISSTVGTGSAIALDTTSVWKNITSISLTAGDWDVTGMGAMGGGASTAQFLCLSAFTGNTTTDLAFGDNASGANPGTVADQGMAIAAWRVSLSGTVTYYLKARAVFTVAPSAYGRISARRVR